MLSNRDRVFPSGSNDLWKAVMMSKTDNVRVETERRVDRIFWCYWCNYDWTGTPRDKLLISIFIHKS